MSLCCTTKFSLSVFLSISLSLCPSHCEASLLLTNSWSSNEPMYVSTYLSTKLPTVDPAMRMPPRHDEGAVHEVGALP